MLISNSFSRFLRMLCRIIAKKRYHSVSQERKLIDSILADQAYTLDHVRVRAECLRDSADMLVKKIDRDGLSGRYSVSHDCLRYSRDVWRGCLRLYEIRKLIEKIDDDS